MKIKAVVQQNLCSNFGFVPLELSDVLRALPTR